MILTSVFGNMLRIGKMSSIALIEVILSLSFVIRNKLLNPFLLFVFQDRSLSIDQQELQTALSRFGYNLSPNFMALLLAKYDNGYIVVLCVLFCNLKYFCLGSRAIGFDNFIQICILLQSLTGEFRKYDRLQVSLSFNTLFFSSFIFTHLLFPFQNGWAQMNYEQFLTSVFNVLPGK